jgi:hypothetical protein
MMASLLFFPTDSDDLSQLYNFTVTTLNAVANNYDSYLADQARMVGLVSIFQTFGLDFTGEAFTEEYGFVTPNRYPEIFAPICTDCSMITILKIGKCGVLCPSVDITIMVFIGLCQRAELTGNM